LRTCQLRCAEISRTYARGANACERVLQKLKSIPARSTGKLHADLYPDGEMSRDDFEEVLGAMARAELIAFTDAVFEKQGKRIPYRNVSILPAGRNFREKEAALFVMRDAAAPAALPTRRRSVSSRLSPALNRRRQLQAEVPPERQARLEQALRAWRLTEAKRRNMPAFRIFGDRTLRNIASTCPRSDSACWPCPALAWAPWKNMGPKSTTCVATELQSRRD
jgi:superfamily II DNA helicase RecQ